MTIVPEQITTHVEDGLDRLLSQFSDKTLVKGLVEAFIKGYQDIEDTGYDMLTKRDINHASGQQLDDIGVIVGKERGGRTDAAYRIALWGKVGQNVSQGRIEDLVSVFNLISEVDKCFLQEHFPAEVALFANYPPVTGDQLLIDNDMETAGVGYWTAVNSATLTKETGAPYAGSQSLRVAFNGIAEPATRQSVLTVGNWYWINGYVKMENAAGPIPLVKNGATTIYTGFAYADWYEFDIIFQATSTDIDFGTDHVAAGWGEYDEIEIYELNYDDQLEIFNVMELVAAGGVRVVGIGFYEEDNYFSFAGDPVGKGFGDLLDPTVGGKFASLTVY